MAAQSEAGSSRPRLNPFLFPSDTDFRFVLLIVSVVGASLVLYSLMFETIPATSEYRRHRYEQCSTAIDPSDRSGSVADWFDRLSLHGDCVAPVDRAQSGWMLGGAVLLLALAGALYWTSPGRKLRRERWVPLTSQDAPEVVADLAELCRTAELRAPPTFVWNPLNSRSSGLAFGRLGRYYVALTGGLVAQFYTDRPAFRAVVLHELVGHLAWDRPL